VDAESVLKMRGQGDAGRSGGAPGDLYITFLVKATAGMKRRGMDLYSEVGVCLLCNLPKSRYALL